MALIIEDGTARPDANSYGSLATIAAYAVSVGNTAWAAAATDNLREAAARRATSYLTAEYRQSWQGSRKTSTQALDWPRWDVYRRDSYQVRGYGQAIYDTSSVPTEVVTAFCELALRELASPGGLMPDLERGVLMKRIGPLMWHYDPNSPQRRRLPFIEGILAPVLNVGAGSSDGFGNAGLSRG